ncbi:MAG: helix-turn-helix domain-containing protein [Solirubrobacteraceae bacterium]
MSDRLASVLLDSLDDAALDRLAELLLPRMQRLAEPSAGDGWLDSRAAAEYLGVSKHSLHRLTAERRIPFSQDQPGSRCYFRRSDLDQWRETGARGPR